MGFCFLAPLGTPQIAARRLEKQMQVPKTWGFSDVGWLQRGFFQFFVDMLLQDVAGGGTS